MTTASATRASPMTPCSSSATGAPARRSSTISWRWTGKSFAYPTNFQCLFPTVCLALSDRGAFARSFGWRLPPTRPLDNMRWDIGTPQEDELVYLPEGGFNYFHESMIFPRTTPFDPARVLVDSNDGPTRPLEGVQPLVSALRAPLRLASRTRTVWQYRPVPTLSGCSTSTRVPGPRLPPASRGCCDSPTVESFHLHTVKQRLVAHLRRRPHHPRSSRPHPASVRTTR